MGFASPISHGVLWAALKTWAGTVAFRHLKFWRFPAAIGLVSGGCRRPSMGHQRFFDGHLKRMEDLRSRWRPPAGVGCCLSSIEGPWSPPLTPCLSVSAWSGVDWCCVASATPNLSPWSIGHPTRVWSRVTGKSVMSVDTTLTHTTLSRTPTPTSQLRVPILRAKQ